MDTFDQYVDTSKGEKYLRWDATTKESRAGWNEIGLPQLTAFDSNLNWQDDFFYWMINNMQSKWTYNPIGFLIDSWDLDFLFEDKNDAILFKLTWS